MAPSIAELRKELKQSISSMHPDVASLEKGHYTLDDILDQLIFEIIIEEYKQYAERHPVQYFLDLYDDEHVGTSRKYTRSIQYAQHFRDYENDAIEEAHGFKRPELEAQDMSGSKTFEGHQFTEHEFLQYKFKAECALLTKLHGRQIESSKHVSNSAFKDLFNEYYNLMGDIEPPVNNASKVISHTYTYYATETYFLTEFLYHITLAAERAGFKKAIPLERIRDVCVLTPEIPATVWCPGVYYATLFYIPKWAAYTDDFFTDSDETWLVKECSLWDSMQVKSFILQRGHDYLVEYMHSCSVREKADFIVEKYWIWDCRLEFEWTPERILYYRKLHAELMRDFPKPHIK